MKKLYKAFQLFNETSKLMKFKKKKRRIAFSIVLSNLIVGLDILIILFFTSFLTDTEIPYIETILSYTFLLPFLILVRFFSVYLDTMNIQILRLGIEEQLKKDLVKKIFSSGNLSSSDSYFYINVLCPNVASFYQYFTTLIGSSIQLLLFTAYIFISNQSEVIYIIAGGVLLYPFIRQLIKLGRQSSHVAFVENQEVSDEVEKIIENLFLIKILKKVDKEIGRYGSYLRNYYTAQVANQKYGTLNSLLPVSISTFVLAVSLLFLSLSFITLDFIGVIIRLFQSLGVFNKNLSWAATQFVFLENLKLTVEDQEKNNNIVMEDFDSKTLIKFNDVSFKYLSSDNYIFEKINLEIFNSKKYLIIGPNGSGKSTLLGLMAGVYYPSKGKINIHSNETAYVSAYPMIIKDSLRNNLLYGNETLQISEEKLIDYIHTFELYKDFEAKDLNKNVSNKTLSSGQMQKIAFIRAFISNPRILFLDESTANLDTRSKEIVKNLLSKKDFTIINSTHNLEDFQNYDYSIELSVTEEGLTELLFQDLNSTD